MLSFRLSLLTGFRFYAVKSAINCRFYICIRVSECGGKLPSLKKKNYLCKFSQQKEIDNHDLLSFSQRREEEIMLFLIIILLRCIFILTDEAAEAIFSLMMGNCSERYSTAAVLMCSCACFFSLFFFIKSYFRSPLLRLHL